MGALLFSLISILLFGLSHGYMKCPPASVDPCQCSLTNTQVVLTCTDLSGQAKLNEIFERIGDYPIHRLVIQNSSISHIPLLAINRARLETIDISRTSMTQLFEGGTVESDDLVSIIGLMVNFKGRWSWNFLKGLSALEWFQMSRTRLEKVERGFVDYMPETIKHLHIFRPGHELQLKDGIFSKLEDLNWIMLDECKIRKLKRNMFPADAHSLRWIDFSYNLLETLPPDMFDNMPALQVIYFIGNKLKHIEEVLWSKVIDNVRNIRIEDNAMECGCDMKWLLDRRGRYSMTANCKLTGNGDIVWVNNLDRSFYNYCRVQVAPAKQSSIEGV